MNNKNAIKNYLFNLSYQALLALCPLITQPYIARVIGASYIGRYSYTQSVVTYFILLGTLGVNVYGQREIAFVQDDKEARSKVFFELLFFKFITVGISLTIYIAIICRHSVYECLYLIQIIDIIATAIDITWFFQGLEEFKKIAIRNIIIKASGIAFIYIFVKSSDDLPIYVACNSITLLFGNLSLWLYLPRYICKVKVKTIEIVRHLRPMIWLFVPQIAASVYTVLDKTMIGLILADTSPVAIYDYVQKLVNLLLTIITSMGTVMLPRISSLFVRDEKRELHDAILNSFSFVFFLGLPMIGGIEVVADTFSVIYWGEEFVGANSILRILSIIILIVGLSNVTGSQYMVPTGQEKWFSLSIVFGAISNIITNSILIKSLGAMGACIASVTAEIVILVIQLFILRNDISIIEIAKKSWKFFVATICMMLVISIIRFGENTAIILVIQIIIGMVVYLGVLLLLKEEYIDFFIRQIIGVKTNAKQEH